MCKEKVQMMKSRTASLFEHQYVERDSGRVLTESPFADWIVNYFYGDEREDISLVYRILGSRWLSTMLGWVNYDFPLGQTICGIQRFFKRCGINLEECLENPERLDSARKVFERQIRYWQCRPMDTDRGSVVCPADSRVLIGSLGESSRLFLKGKFFDYEELVGTDKKQWLGAFRGGDFLICRLTPEKYHYNHTPAAGLVLDSYENNGAYHSCNPGSVIAMATPYSKNKRFVTVIDTDVPNGTRVGLIAMIEIVALMIGDIVQCYSELQYVNPRITRPGMHLRRGCPKSLYRPGSSTTVLLFQRGRVQFEQDLVRNISRTDIKSRFSQGFGRALVETDVKVRSTIATRKRAEKRR
jgi:phosphatidylserine decarboxylase